MSVISLQAIMRVFLPVAILVIVYHVHLNARLRHDPLKTATGTTNHARQMWVKGIMRDRSLSLMQYPRPIPDSLAKEATSWPDFSKNAKRSKACPRVL